MSNGRLQGSIALIGLILALTFGCQSPRQAPRPSGADIKDVEFEFIREARLLDRAEREREEEVARRVADQVARIEAEAESNRQAQEDSRRQAASEPRRPTDPDIAAIDFGDYHALVIGNDTYTNLPHLKTAVGDARAVDELLRNDYGFTVSLLIDARRDELIDVLDRYRETLGARDNLLIYYAGHGWLDEESGRGYWLPVDAKRNRRSKWLSNADITDTLKSLLAKHVLVVADSCYSGTLTRGVDVKLRTADHLKRMATKRARVALTSGGLEPVVDKGGSGHSPFAKAFLDVLGDNHAVMDATRLFTRMRRPVMVNADQTPQYADVRNAGHDGGDFLFVRRR
jgi:hypothetical protein